MQLIFVRKVSIGSFNWEASVRNSIFRVTVLKLMIMTMPTLKTSDDVPATQSVCDFFAKYSSWLLGCGATCIRLEKNVRRMAEAYGKEVDITIMPRHVHVLVRGRDSDGYATSDTSVRQTPISFNINTRFSELSWEVADKKISLDSAVAKFEEIVTNDSQNKLLVLVLVSFANASFCRLFGGDAIAMLIVGIATAVGFWLKNLLLARKFDTRAVFVICSFVSAVFGATDILFSMGETPTVSLGTSVLFLVPGVPFLNSFNDLLCRHYICAFCRFIDAVVLTCCLSFGLCMGMLLMNVGMF